MEDIGDLINRWQDALLPGLNRPFRLAEYVTDDAVCLSDSRQGGARLKISRERMEADIEMKKLLREYDSVLNQVGTLVRRMENTPDRDIRTELRKELQTLDTKGAELRDQLDALEELE